MNSTVKPLLLVALGGNALVRSDEEGTIGQQFANLQRPVRQLARLARDHRLILTHGNGPQVGNLLLQQESCREVPRLPLEILVAQTQGQLGYMLESSLNAAFAAAGLDDPPPLVSLISYVVVDPDDPAFHEPTKPIGPFYPRRPAEDFPVVKTPRGWRRVVASPEPRTVVEKREIRLLVEQGFVVICCGGGGIPVVREGRGFQGVDAVIDKDLAGACLALEVGVDIFLIATDVPGVALDFGGARQRFLRRLGGSEARAHLAAGQFAPGSMGPKVEACLRFLQGGGKRALICAVEDIEAALRGEAGTEIIRD
ncbi:carbamate kinase [Geoalkalibacter halelectricus]|uniref:carbamate kinase n=1 Tax=Geoalkalibacter halelectricus TaxID=2847045 RepID=UPI003D1E3408